MMLALTERQEQLWRYLKSCERCPSFQEMCDHMGLHSKSNVFRLVNELEAKGYVSRVGDGCYRMVRGLIVHDGPKAGNTPLSRYSMRELIEEVDNRLGLAAMAA